MIKLTDSKKQKKPYLAKQSILGLKINAITLVIVTLSFLLLYLSLHQYIRDYVNTKIENQLNQALAQVIFDLKTERDTIQREIKSFSTNPILIRAADIESSRGVSQHLNRLLATHPHFNHILLIDRYHEIIAANTKDTKGLKVASELIFGDPIDHYIKFSEGFNTDEILNLRHDPFLQHLSQQKDLVEVFSLPIEKHNQVLGWVIATHSWQKPAQTLLNRLQQRLIATGIPLVNATLFYRSNPLASTEKEGNTDQQTGIRIRTRTKSQAIPSSKHLSVTVTIDAVKANQIFNDLTRRILITIIIAAPLIFLLLSAFFNRIVTQRIETTLANVKRIQQGDLSTAIGNSSKDEVGRLQQGIEEMRRTLLNSQSDLEQRIEERTEELKASREDIFKITESAPQLLSYVGADLRYRFANKAYERWFGISAKEMVGKSIVYDIDEASYRLVEPYVKRVLAGEVVEFEAENTTPDGQYRYARATYKPDFEENEDGEITDIVKGFFVFIEDISASKKAEKELTYLLNQLNEQKYVLDQHAIVAITDLNGTITYANTKFREISGYLDNELLGENHRILNSQRHEQVFFSDLYQTISAGDIWHNEICNRSKSGQEYWVDTTIAPMLDGDGKPQSYISIGTDITMVKLAEFAMADAKQMAENATRIKSEFLASMSHEIRTPMNGILGMLGLLSKSNLENTQRRQLELAENSAKTLLDIINDILDFSKIEAGKLSIELVPFNLLEFFDEVTSTQAIAACNKQLELVIDTSEIVKPLITADPGRLRQILLNLIGNAIKFTKQGSVTIRVRQTIVDDHRSRLHCSVTDTGIGIEEDQQEQLFAAFTQADASTTRQYGGTGLGLSITKQLCQLMGGKISVHSTPNEGSCFEFFLEVDTQPQQSPNEILANRSISALVFDHSGKHANALKQQLKHLSIPTQATESLSQLKTLLKESDSDSTVIFINHQNSSEQRLPLLEEINTLENLVPTSIIAMVDGSNSSREEELLKQGYDEIIYKPVSTQKILQLVNKQESSPATSIPQTTASSPAIREHKRVLLVEDNAINQEVAKGIMNKLLETPIDIAENGLEALNKIKMAEANQDTYAVIYMDCQMPKLDGYETTQAIRAGKAGDAAKKIPIIAMTANAMIGDREKCIKAGMNDYISKPIEPDIMEASLNKYLATMDSKPNGLTTALTGATIQAASNLLTWNKNSALKRVSGREELLIKLINLFFTDAPQLINEIENNIRQQNYDDLKINSHTLKGVAGNIGAEKLMHLLKDVEECAIKQTDKVEQQVPQLIASFDEVYAELKSYYASQK